MTVHNDPAELEKFIYVLEKYLNTISEESDYLNDAFEELGECWQDEKRDIFKEKFDELMTTQGIFKESMEEILPSLKRLKEALDGVENIHM